jgi:hypothetical protein
MREWSGWGGSSREDGIQQSRPDPLSQLFDATRPDFTPLYRELAELPDVPANGTLPGDQSIPLG